ncbi:MAG: hypothetical protein WA842_05030 [Croceibacterium sp.]
MATTTTPAPTASTDAELIAAWADFRAGQIEMEDLDDDAVGSGNPAEAEIWRKIDGAEAIIQQTPAKSPRGAAIKLWVALAHITTDRTEMTLVVRRDRENLIAIEQGMDWDARLILSAIQSLEGMEA